MTQQASHQVFEGCGIAPGIAIGKAAIVEVGHFPRDVPRYQIAAEDVEREVARFRMAADQARADVDKLVLRVAEQVGEPEANILRGHSMMLEDPAFSAQVQEFVVEHRVNVETAVAEVMHRFAQLFASRGEEFLRERAAAVRDVTRRLLGKLLFVDGEVATQLEEPRVVVSEHLVPSLTVHLTRKYVLGFATERGGATSHAAILARSAGLPAVSGLEGIGSAVVHSQMVIVDGIEGKVIVSPTEDELETYRELASRFRADRERVMASSREPAVTRDGAEVRVLANVGRPGDVAAASEYGAQGIGLYRTEFEFMDRNVLPSEDELTEVYGRAVRTMEGAAVTIRVLDIGGDKFPPAFPLPHEENPYLGYRGIRVLLEHSHDLLLPQLRALLRASVKGPLRVMYPMVSGLAEFRAAAEQFHHVGRLGPGRSARGGGLRFGRHQRPGAIRAGRGPQQRSHGRILRPPPPGGGAYARVDYGHRAAGWQGGRRLWRGGGRSALRAAARGAGVPVAECEPRCHAVRQGLCAPRERERV